LILLAFKGVTLLSYNNIIPNTVTLSKPLYINTFSDLVNSDFLNL
jgi:hypothetical protein